MSIPFPVINLKKLKSQLDWKLLIFLVLFLDVKLVVKIAAIVLIYILQTDFHFGFRLKDSRLPLFYPLVMALAVIGALINASLSAQNYWLVFLTGLGFWLLCLLAIHQVKLAVERNETDTIHRTLLVFFILNAIISLLNIALIIFKIGALNPYTYQGEYQKYFLNTGDYIKGLTFDTSTTNAVICAFGLIYFLVRKQGLMVLVCMATLLLTVSNTLNILLMVILLLLFIFRSTREQKSLIAACIFLLVLFMAKISPQNNTYVVATINNILHRPNKKIVPLYAPVPIEQRPDSSLTWEEKRVKKAQLYIDSVNKLHQVVKVIPQVQQQKIQLTKTINGRIVTPKDSIYTATYQSLVSTPADELPLVTFIDQHKAELPISGQPFHWSGTPGKLIAARQTADLFKAHPAKLIAGDGMGNFSSKLAFKATSLAIAGNYPAKKVYIDHDFMANHLDLYLNYFSKRAGFHSLTNSPFSVYDQIIAEYGIVGLLIFGIYYLWFFAKKAKVLTYGLPILLLLLPVLAIDYWFEQLSIIILFELLLLLDIKESTAKTQLQYEHR
jgi:hypothetical protein